VLIPSLAPETSSLVAREALACGTPVVAFPNGALSETVEHGRTGFLVETVEAMAEAIKAAGSIDPAFCREVARERFSLARMTSRYLDLYARLARAPPTALPGAA
jgi:glycosyltransferase involved in cell wall biosynthesis